MQMLATIAGFRKARKALAGTLGLVPTMGFLHEGHLTLVRRARGDNESVAVTIFVNPTQFGPSDDLDSYPRDMDRDLRLLENEGVDLVFAPTPEEMYPTGFESHIEVGSVAQLLEGAHRPGHFHGVATVVAKLFNIVRPDRAYFGQKDAQQVRVIQRMAGDLDFPVEIVVVPTVREPDGLAMSSRNMYLSAEERRASLSISGGLRLAQDRWSSGERNADALRAILHKAMEAEPLMRIDYVSLAHAETLEELQGVTQGPCLLSLAALVGKARLIDNVTLD